MTKKRYGLQIFLLLCASGILLSGCSLDGKTSSDAYTEATTHASGEIQILTIGTADSGGTMYPAGSAIAKAISSQMQDIKVNISASNGSISNVEMLMEGQIDMGLVSGDVAYAAYYGREEFTQKPEKGLRAVAAVYSSLSNWMAPDASGLTYVHDLKGKRISVGPQNSTTELSARIALNIIGLDASNTSFKNYGLGSAGTQVKQGDLDALHGFAGIPVAGLLDLSKTVPCRLLKYTDGELAEILASNPYYYRSVIPKETYPGQTEPVDTFGVKCLLCVSDDMDEELIYSITKILDQSSGQMSATHESMKDMEDKEFMYGDLPIPLHPGAAKYYRDAGYIE